MYRLLLFIPLIFISCQENQDDRAKQSVKSNTTNKLSSRDVEAYIIKPDIFFEQLLANGKIESQSKVDLRFKKQDRISDIFVKNGQFVKEGTTLASQDNYNLKNQLEDAKLRLKKAKWEKEKMLVEFNLSDTSTSKSLDYINLQSGFCDAKNYVDKIELLLDETILKAPFSGFVANLTTKQGNYSSITEPFCSIISKDKLEVVFYILDNEKGMVRIGGNVDIFPYANKNNKYKGKISDINPEVDQNGMIRIKAKLLNTDSKLIAGMSVKIIVNKKTNKNILIPKSALVLRGGKEVVFSLSNNLAKWNYVTICGENSEYYAIEKGVNIGDTIIVSNNLNLSHNADVKAKRIW